MKYKVYTDGSCKRNPGPGGYAYMVVKENGAYTGRYGWAQDKTQAYMELKAVINALERLAKWHKGERIYVEMFTPSSYVHNAIVNGGLKYWVQHGWKTDHRSKVKHVELWRRYLNVTNYNQNMRVKFVHVKPNRKLPGIKMVDKMAREGSALAEQARLNLQENLPQTDEPNQEALIGT